MAHTYNLDEFKAKFAVVKQMGFVPSQRRGPTGVGHTLEQLLGMTENNIAIPDLGEVELKARRITASSMVTLFTFNRKVWQVRQDEAIELYGSFDKNNRKGMYYTMSRQPNGAGLFLHIDDEEISVRHISGRVITLWKLEQLAAQFMKKIPAVVVVSALSELRDDVEWFQYTRAQLLYGTSGSILQEQIAAGNVLVDLRLHAKPRGARNHGTGFRCYEDRLTNLFKNVEELS